MANYDKLEYHMADFISVKADRIIRQTKCYKIGEDYVSDKKRTMNRQPSDKKQTMNRQPIERKFHNFKISVNSQKNLREKINWLYRFAKSRTITTYSGKRIDNFKVSFITLTLPAKQMHPTSIIVSECFSPLLTLLRNHLKMENYVWKLEFQKNGNAHFHLLTDTYIDYHYIRQKWNDKLKALGYVDAYQDKFKSYSLHQYLNEFSDGSEVSISKCCKWYANGRASNWRNPNTADVRNVVSDRQLSVYLSKYLSKQSKAGGNEQYDDESNSFALRLCFWSRSLSACNSVQLPAEAYEFDFEGLVTYDECFDYRRYDYCDVLYFRWEKFTNYLKGKFFQFFTLLRQEFGYRPCYN